MTPAASTGRRSWEGTRWLSWGFSALGAAFFVAMLAAFVGESLPVWRREGLDFLTGHEWFYRAERFGMLPMLYGTAVVAAVALVLAAPLGLGAAIFTAEFLPHRTRLLIKGTIELLAGIPSVVYGLLGVVLLRQWIYRLTERWEPLSGDTLLTGGVLLAVMVLPTITSLADDALAAVPESQRLAARGLGLDATQTVFAVSLPQALPGLAAAVLLAFGRAVGETIAVFLVIGRQDNQLPETLLSPRPLVEAGQTLTSKLGGSETFLAYGDPLHWGAISGLALVLFLFTVTLTGVGFALAEWSRHRV